MSGDETPTVTLAGTDGSVLKYFAFAGSDYSPGEVGWVLVVEHPAQTIDPQALSVTDVVGDIRATVTDAGDLEAMLAVVQWRTEDLILALEGGDVAPVRHEGEPTAEVRLAQLQAEHAEAFST